MGGLENCIKEFEIDSGGNQVLFSVFCKMRWSCWSGLEMRKLELYSADNVVEPRFVQSRLCPDDQEALTEFRLQEIDGSYLKDIDIALSYCFMHEKKCSKLHNLIITTYILLCPVYCFCGKVLRCSNR